METVVLNEETFTVSSPISVTINIFSFDKVLERSVSYTKKIVLPLSEQLILLIGNSQSYQSKSDIPYINIQAKYVSDGTEILNGIAQITSIKKQVEFNIFELPISFFDRIKGKKLYELQYLTNSSFHASDIDSFRTNTTGILCPVLDWGLMDELTLNSDFYLPSFSYREIIEEIFIYSGFSYEAEVFSDEYLNSIIIPFSNPELKYPAVFNQQWDFYVLKVSSDSSFTAEQIITYQGIVSEGSQGIFDAGLTGLQMPTLGVTGDYIQTTVTATLRFEATGSAGNSFYWRLILNRSSVESTLDEDLRTMVAGGLGGDVELSATVDLRDGDQVYVKYVPNSGTPTLTVSGGFGFIKAESTGKVFDNYMFFNYLLPDITMDEIISDFIKSFGIIITEERNNLLIRTLEDIIKDRSQAKDWTDKFDSQEELILSAPYSQENYFEYQDNTDEELGKGSISISDVKLSPESTLYTSIFGNAPYKTNLFVNTAFLNVYDADSVDRSDFANEPGLRRLVIREKKSSENLVTFDATLRGDYYVALFDQPDEDTSAGFDTILSLFYPSISEALNNYKGVKRYYNLNQIDINNKPIIIFDMDAYFLIKKIDFVKNKKSKVEMFKLP